MYICALAFYIACYLFAHAPHALFPLLPLRLQAAMRIRDLQGRNQKGR
jgi:hypothetical protein